MERITAEKSTIKASKVSKETSDKSTKPSHKLALIIRTITAPPFMAILLSTILYLSMGSNAFATRLNFLEAILCLGVLPLLAYPLCAIVPSLRKKGRKLERSIAIVFSVVGYVMGTAFALLSGGTSVELTLYFTYLISGVMTALLSFVFKFKASGHACGASGPVAMLIYYLGPLYFPMFAILGLVFASSLRLGRHNLAQLIVGSIVPVAALAVAAALVGIIV